MITSLYLETLTRRLNLFRIYYFDKCATEVKGELGYRFYAGLTWLLLFISMITKPLSSLYCLDLKCSFSSSVSNWNIVISLSVPLFTLSFKHCLREWVWSYLPRSVHLFSATAKTGMSNLALSLFHIFKREMCRILGINIQL